MKKVIMLAAMIAAFGLGGAAAFAGTSDKPPSPPGQPDCEHGNSQKPCKDDPNPDHGQDCDEHGNQGGQNEDHCKNETPPTDTTPTDTTPTDTTPTETTPAETSSNETSSDGSSPQESGGTESSPTETTSSPEASSQVYSPPASQAAAETKPELVASNGASASKPSTAAQVAPFTP